MRVLCFSDCASLLLLVVLVHATIGSYVITTPRKWAAGSRAQFCITIDGDASPEDEIRVKVYSKDQPSNNFGGGFWRPRPIARDGDEATKEEKTLLIPEKILKPHAGSPMTCDQLSVPATPKEHGEIEIIGKLSGTAINETRDINIATDVSQTFVQTDKYLYKAGQKVQFRVLTLQGPFFKVNTEPYPMIYVETPSGSRIAQWLDVANPSGLIHLDMQLIDEPEEGVYNIKVESPVSSERVTKSFKIEDYVLPRFEVKLKPPPYILADAQILKFEVCATYTFGQPVKGNISVNLHNNGWGRRKLEMNFKDQLSGCKKIEIPMRTFDINNRNYYVYSISASVTVEEEGTGTEMTESTSISITRTVLTMKDIETSSYRKPELPYTQAVKVEFPDGSPGSEEAMSVCVEKVCTNLTTDAAGVLRYTVPPHLNKQNAKVISLNYPRRNLPGSTRSYMYESQHYSYGNNYHSPSNSSLTIMPDSTKLQCVAGEGINLSVPVLYAAANVTQASLHLQVVSRGQIQYWDTQTVQLTGGDLAIDEASLVEPMQPPYSPFTVRGTVYLPVTLPSTVSPSVKVVVWYSRDDDEVVSDAREIEISKCLDHKVELSWPRDRVEQGTQLPLTLTAEPSSLCSLGIVDKSVELLSSQQDSLTLDKIFALAERASIKSWENSQIDDYEYCRKLHPPAPVVPPTPIALSIEVDLDNPTTVTLSWIPRYNRDTGASNYTVHYKLDDERWMQDARQVSVGEDSSATISSLTPGKTYKFRVVASNSAGESSPSRIMTHTIPLTGGGDAPEAPLVPVSANLEELPMMDGPVPPPSAEAVVRATEHHHEKEYGPPAPPPAGPAEATPALSLDAVAAIRRKRSSPPFGGRRYGTSLVDAIKMFDESGLYVISDLTLETRPCKESYPVQAVSLIGTVDDRLQAAPRPQFSPAPGVVFDAPTAQDSGPSPARGATDDSSVRSYFPETWLWQLNMLPSDSGSLVQDLTLPDTITEWVGRAVCVHPSKGLGISGPTSITTFTPFFVDLTVLPSVKKEEIMPIIISVFNYQPTGLPVRITLEASPEYEILNAEGEEAATVQESAGVTSVCIPANDKETVTIRVRPQAVGQVNVTVNAVVDAEYPELCGPEVLINKVDRIISPITVEYEGFPREKTWTKYICSEDLNENADFAEEWRLEAPTGTGIVPESARSWITVVGDLLGLTLDNLGSLIKMPYGCGEQNMLNFAPNIYVHQYLDASLQNNEATAEKLKRFMKSGYQRELKYKHSDGSFSAFGESDDSGSTWLTAFVVKSFAQARPFISVDATELTMSTEWLIRRQLENGCFQSVGKVLHKGMKGGAADGGNPGVLSAYVMAALIEAGQDPTSQVIANAVYCLEAATKAGGLKPYEAALKVYAFSLAGLPEAQPAMTDLLSLAIDTSEGFYWDVPNSKGSSHSHSSNTDVNPVSVEIAGYALMSMLNLDAQKYSTLTRRIVKWISAQRNSQGGFISTQDTIVALQALALYESHQSQEPLDLMTTIIGDGLTASFKVNEKNKLLTQRVEVPSIPLNVQIDIAGTGCTLVQGVVRYNVKDAEPSEAFNISVTTSNDYSRNSCKSMKIRTCAAYLLNDEQSNMAVIEVNLVSGYIPEKEDLKRVVGYGTGIIKRYEVDGSKVLFYVDQFTEREVCVEFGVLKEVAVEQPKPGTVKVYDYYEPEFVVTETYTIPRRWDCNRRPIIDEESFGLDFVRVAEPPAPPPIAIAEEIPVATEPQPAVDELLEALEDMP